MISSDEESQKEETKEISAVKASLNSESCVILQKQDNDQSAEEEEKKEINQFFSEVGSSGEAINLAAEDTINIGQ